MVPRIYSQNRAKSNDTNFSLPKLLFFHHLKKLIALIAFISIFSIKGFSQACPGAIAVVCEADAFAAAEAAVTCVGVIPESASYVGGPPVTPICAGSGVSVTVRVLHADPTAPCGGGSNFCDVIVNITGDAAAPVFAGVPAAVSVDCIENVPAMIDLMWTDDCDGSGMVTGTDGALTGGSCGGTITRTWTYTDACGNTGTETQTITVDDNVAPIIVEAAGTLDAAFTCHADVVVPAMPTATDNCMGSTVTINTVSDVTTPGACANSYVRIITYNATDDCLNASPDYTVTITVNDNVAPTIDQAVGALDANFTCDADVVVPSIPTATDNCTGNTVTINTISDITTPGSCSNQFVRVITYSASDGCGNTSPNYTVTITVNDNVAPTFNQAAGALDATFSCDANVIVPPAPTATDNCSGNTVTINTVSDISTPMAGIPVGCVDKYTRVITYNADDGCGNTSSNYTVTITVNDATAPTVTCPADFSVPNAIGNCNNGVGWATPLVTDGCGGAVSFISATATDSRGTDIAISDPGGSPTATLPVGENIIEYTYEDPCGNQGSCSFVITVEDTEAPDPLVCPSPQTLHFADCDATASIPDYSGLLTTSDNCSDVVVEQTNPLPGTLLSTIATPADGEVIIVTLVATDNNGAGQSVSCTFNVVLDEDNSLTLSNPVAILPTESSTCGSLTITAPTAFDACGNFVCGIPLPMPTAPPVGACNPAGASTQYPPISSGAVNIGIDNPLGSNTTITSTISVSNLDPVLQDLNISLDIDHTWVGDLSATLTSPNGNAIPVNLFNQVGTVPNPFSDGCSGNDMNLTLDDEASLSYNNFQNACGVSFFNSGDTPAIDGTYQPQSPLSAFDGEDPNGDWILTIIDNFGGLDGGELIEWSLEISASGPSSIPEYTFEPTSGNQTITWTFDDGNGNTTSQSQVINVATDAVPPTLTCSDITLELDENGEASISGGTLLGEGLTLGGVNSNFATYCVTPTSETTFSFAWSNTVEAQWDPFGYSIGGSPSQLTVNNASGGIGSQSGMESVTVPAGTEFCFFQNNDFSVPSSTNVILLPGLIGDLSIANWTPSADGANYNEPNITDVCGVNNPTILANGSATVSFDCSDLGANTVAVTANDINNNFGTCLATITIEDNSVPVFEVASLPDAIVNADCSSVPAIPADPTATDNCGTVGINFNEASTQTGNSTMCGNYNYTITRTWTATDGEGNQTVFEQTVQVSDNEAPVVTLPTEITVPANPGAGMCFATVSLVMTSADVSDNCAAFTDLTITNDAVVGDGLTDASGDYSIGDTDVTFTVVDPCGKTTTHTVTVTVEDTTAPVASCTNNVSVTVPSGASSLTLDPGLVDNGSFDNCGTVTLEVFRLAANGVTQLPPVFDCSEADGVTSYDVVLVVTGPGGQQSTCETTVIVQDNTAPVAMCQDITVFLDVNGNASITPDMIDDGSTDACSGIANITLLTQTDFTVADVGPNTATLLVTDVNGNNAICNATVTVAPPVTCFDIDDNFIAGTGFNEVPLTTTNFVNVQGFQFTLEIDETVGTFVGVNNLDPSLASGAFSAIANATGDTLTISWLNTSGTPLTLNTAQLFTITVDVIGAVGSMTPIDFINTPTPPELIVRYGTTIFTNPLYPPCTDDGEITVDVTATLNVSGNIRTWGLIVDTFVVMPGDTIFNFAQVPVQGVANAIVSKSESHPNIPGSPLVAPNAAFSATNGDYTAVVQNQPGGVDLELDPRKETDWLNGPDVSSSDLFFIQEHIVNNIPFTSIYEYVASDVNQDGLVTTLDIVLVQDVIVNPPGSPQPSIVITTFEPWRFVPAMDSLHLDPLPMLPNAPPLVDDLISLPNYTTALTNVDWIAVKIGQVNGSLDPSLLVGNDDPTLTQLIASSADFRSGNDLVMQVENQKVTQDELISIPVYAKDYAPFISWQFTFEFDESTLAYEGMLPGSMSNFKEGKLGLNAVEEGIIGAAWYGMPSEVNQEEPLFTLQFRALENAEALSGLIDVTSRTVRSETALINGSKGEVSLEFLAPTTANLVSDFDLHQNRPNPFNDKTLISFVLPEASSAKLTIFDISGRVLKLVEGDFVKGYNEVSLQSSEISATGVLYYKLESAEHTATKKMIILN